MGIHEEYNSLAKEHEKLLESLKEMVKEHCSGGEAELDCKDISVNRRALLLLGELDIVYITQWDSKRVLGYWKE